MNNEIIQIVAHDNYGEFRNSTSYLNENSFHYFKDYLMTKLIVG